jgi:cell division protein FtsN
MVLVSGRDPLQVREARFLGSLSYAFRTGDAQTLASLLAAGEELTAERKCTILYALWKITGNESYRTRLRTEHPSSPEAKSLEENPNRQIAGASTAMWLLFPGRDAVSLGTPAVREPDRASQAPSTAPQITAAQAPARTENTAAAATVVLQTGLFSREENAQAMVNRLKRAGFTPVVSRRTVNGNAYFAVSVNASGDINAAILHLKDSGFEAFPVY